MRQTKKCEICGEEKSQSEFSKSYRNRCRTCVAKLTRDKRQLNGISATTQIIDEPKIDLNDIEIRLTEDAISALIKSITDDVCKEIGEQAVKIIHAAMQKSFRIMKKTTATIHMSINIRGLINYYCGRSMMGLMKDDNGKKMTDKEVRTELQRHISLGHTILPMCDDKDCPDFDYFGGGCPGHGIHYYDNDNNEITKEQYESALNAMKGGTK